ncbi:hypothetical protein ACWD27_35965, partial [Streptomyces sp. NPDC002758]
MRVVLAEDLFLLRDGLVRMLEAYDFEIAAAVETGRQLPVAEAIGLAQRAPLAVTLRLRPAPFRRCC